MLRTDYGVLDAHLGPSLFLKQHDLIPLKGDELEVTGSKFAGDLPVILIAKELTTPSTKLMTLFNWRRIGRGVRKNSSSPPWASPV